MKLEFLLSAVSFVYGVDWPTYENMCAACLNANPRFRYHCGVCTDDARREEKLARNYNREDENRSRTADYYLPCNT